MAGKGEQRGVGEHTAHHPKDGDMRPFAKQGVKRRQPDREGQERGERLGQSEAKPGGFRPGLAREEYA